MKLRGALDALYDSAGVLAALFLAGTLVMVLLGIAGRAFAFHIAGTDAYAGYCTASAGFLALAHTLKRGEHIRVSLLLERAGVQWNRVLEIGSLAAALALACAFAYFSVRLAVQSFEFNDISTANDATPLWIPQLTMAAGTVVFAIAFADELVLEILGKRSRRESAELLHNE